MKKLVIKIGGNMMGDIRELFQNPQKFRGEPSTHTHYIKSPEELYEIFSPKRIELLAYLLAEKGESVTKVSRALKRKQEAISRDANILVRHGMIEKTKEGHTTILKAKYGTLEISLA